MALIELFAIFIGLDQVCNRPVIDNLLLLFHLPGFFLNFSIMDYIWEPIKMKVRMKQR